MSDVQQLLDAIEAAGVTIQTNGSNLVVQPASRLPAVLKERLREHKTEVLRRLDLEASRKALETNGVYIAVCDMGEMRVVVTETDAVRAIDGGYVIYSPEDMYRFVALNPCGRRVLHEFKKRFGGSTEWSESEGNSSQ